MGRASGSWRLTIRVAPSGVCPASQRRVWATTRSRRSAVSDGSATIARAFPLASLPAWRSDLAALAATRRGSARAASVMPVMSVLMAFTSSFASSLRRPPLPSTPGRNVSNSTLRSTPILMEPACASARASAPTHLGRGTVAHGLHHRQRLVHWEVARHDLAEQRRLARIDPVHRGSGLHRPEGHLVERQATNAPLGNQFGRGSDDRVGHRRRHVGAALPRAAPPGSRTTRTVPPATSPRCRWPA